MPGTVKILLFLLLALMTGGCATTFVPISWGFGDKVQQLSRSDLFLKTLFDRYDPERSTLRVAGASFDQVMMPSEVKHHLGAYRRDTKLIYRSLYQEYSEAQLRTLMLHELSHHIWFSAMNEAQHEQWRSHLQQHPTPLQAMVRQVYSRKYDYDTEDFAFTVEFARQADIEALASLSLITPEERDAILKERRTAQAQPSILPLSHAGLHSGTPGPGAGSPQPLKKGNDNDQ
ncbi:MAG TPA: hypothetical protein DCZ75_05085 [Geobacter sp.]|nr:hypothetical protein [Geobacter sp.]